MAKGRWKRYIALTVFVTIALVIATIGIEKESTPFFGTIEAIPPRNDNYPVNDGPFQDYGRGNGLIEKNTPYEINSQLIRGIPIILKNTLENNDVWYSHVNPQLNKKTLESRDDFHSYSEMTSELQTITATYPDITNLYELGTSVQGRIIWGLKITDKPDLEENEPEVRIAGLHHGNELMSAELPLLLAWHLVINYSFDSYIS